MRVGVIGVGCSRFGRRDDAVIQELAYEAVKEALDDAGITQDEVELSVVGSVNTRGYELMPAVPVNEYCGFAGKGPLRVEAACATGAAAVYTAYTSIASGMADVAIAIGVEKMTEVDTATSLAIGGRAGNYLWEFHQYGTTFPAYYAMHATAHMAKYGTTEEQMAKVAVKAHRNAARNPKAHFQKEIAVEDVLNSRYITYPLKLYDCSPISDGSAAAILASEEKIRELGIDDVVWIDSVGYASDTSNMTNRESFVGLKATVLAREMAYRKAGIEEPVKQLDFATVHDCFTIAEIMAYEDLGFCRKGEGGKLVESGETELGGKLPVNTFGGLKAKGHPLAATGVAMVYEIVKQLRGEAGELQVELRNNRALLHNVGGTGHFAFVMIFGR
ncbi:thiolase domain-containing protein [Archaeoglobus fulgidus]|jgi:acetyl-CoA C-acetyltransferase|uniref:3-ketoacyl-CoA thiolase (AcaB-8) n=3 Tax=Archaeoglobus fulgidus TaxID=2234 RepID=O29811_ARCFU|nr:thiolase domain-containing protein [Archaeoglobus fulgidus]AAB90795.1 3-ketoacyl-CoA thiolase (acaB-8) [Archaeoglobus fulgidus DSM 4304]AIG97256.1 Acetyl-CoA acetyltransferase [Archaeoglobus fulgidus DSM 8774]KUJ92583.1 MAG: 3-ketoacyl-CoA thiolase (AcaB-8) [Archaeoglobus fulgidus]KUK05710.1 MAG: 3-ketoacyl-CoA thiolase (AcaB-8) [Archaeoglobus fulgidus]